MPSKETKKVLAEAIYQRIKEQIMDQAFQPGTRLNIDALALELNVSPTPVRESLARLAAERLVTFESFKGYSVNQPLNSRQIADLMHVRRLIELDAVQKAAQRILFHELMLLEENLSQEGHSCSGSWGSGYQSFNQLDQMFHEIVVTAADNPYLLDAYKSLNIHILLARFHPYFEDGDQCDTCNEHIAILEALKNHDPRAAVQAIENHLHNTEIRIFGFQNNARAGMPNTQKSLYEALQNS
jgi:DNA-binding GntR family transcriptional regulator